jgi:hypothetical protein
MTMRSKTSDRGPATSPRAELQRLSTLWDEHVHNEFQARNTPATLDTDFVPSRGPLAPTGSWTR